MPGGDPKLWLVLTPVMTAVPVIALYLGLVWYLAVRRERHAQREADQLDAYQRSFGASPGPRPPASFQRPAAKGFQRRGDAR